jgi:hypothetical protein
MGLHLDWEIEAENATVDGHKEDKYTARQRRLARLRILLGSLIIIGLLASAYGVFVWRLRLVDAEIERALRDTVEAEVATLRFADRNAFLNIQRSASDTWQEVQTQTFDDYQRLLSTSDVQLTGNIVSMSVDGPRGRVQVEEIIDGVPYVRTWFYWRFADNEGWRHVPPDYTFWGDTQTLERPHVTVRYRDLDEPVATLAAEQISGWIDWTCTRLTCGDIPTLTLEIVPQEGLTTTWTDANAWTMQMPSPYIGVPRLDRPFSPGLQIAAANLIAERLVMNASNNMQPVYPADSVYVRQAIVDWLVGYYTNLDTASYLINSYADRYGVETVQPLLSELGPGSDIRVLLAPASVNMLSELEIDWRDYLTWRLNTEIDVHTRRDEANYVGMYDTRLAETTNIAFSRFNQPIATDVHEVIAVQPEVQPDGIPGLRAIVRIGEGETATQTDILFRLSDEVWKRAN